jgi:hypothetical protein
MEQNATDGQGSLLLRSKLLTKPKNACQHCIVSQNVYQLPGTQFLWGVQQRTTHLCSFGYGSKACLLYTLESQVYVTTSSYHTGTIVVVGCLIISWWPVYCSTSTSCSWSVARQSVVPCCCIYNVAAHKCT